MLQCANNFFGVMGIHLAAEGLKVEGFFGCHGNPEYRAFLHLKSRSVRSGTGLESFISEHGCEESDSFSDFAGRSATFYQQLAYMKSWRSTCFVGDRTYPRRKNSSCPLRFRALLPCSRSSTCPLR